MKISYFILISCLVLGSCEEKQLPSDVISCANAYVVPIVFPNYDILLNKKNNAGDDYFVIQKIDTAAIFIQRIGKNGQLENRRKTKSIMHDGKSYVSFDLKREDCINRDLNFKELISYPNGMKDTVAVFYKAVSYWKGAQRCVAPKCPRKSKYGAGFDLVINGKLVLVSSGEKDHFVQRRIISF